jgi:hypothetical protein
MEGNREWLRGLVGMEVGVVVRELLNILFDETVDIPFEHWAIDVKSKLLNNVLVDPSG